MSKKVIKKEKSPFVETVGKSLTERQKLFCRYYLGMGHVGTRGNAVQSYWDAYYAGNVKREISETGEIEYREISQRNPVTGEYSPDYNNARIYASRLYATRNIQDYLKELVKDVDIEFEMGKVIKQDESMASKVQASTLLARMTGRLKDNAILNIPELGEIANGIKGILGNLKK